QIYMVALSSYETTHNTVLFDRLEALYAPTNRPDIPESTPFSDALQAIGGFPQSGHVHSFDVPAPGARYATATQGGFAVTTLAAEGGGIFAADSDQWRRFLRDIRATDTEYVVILMDANPVNFRQRMEFELFHLALQTLRDEGRTIFVASATGTNTVLTMRDGIRYIDLANPQEGVAAIQFWTGIPGEILWGYTITDAPVTPPAEDTPALPVTPAPQIPPTDTPPEQSISRILRFAIDNTVFTDNGTSYMLEAAPFIASDRTMVPLRVIGEALGATNLAHNAGVITFNIGSQAFTMTVGQPLASNMGTPVIIADRTFVPLAFIVEEMGAVARWDRDERAAYIYIG
ncbi:MAG: copper amine oxidase N-terminal domain-containing protein, partial [Defluviitaleaceae bacterium]|nr:copper amine oxidase N-terminal domain-containing protein [Defluviitaleaceae bacterium]